MSSSLSLSASDEPVVSARIASFAYPGAVSPILWDVRMTVQRGERVHVRGDTGSGKSTLLGLLSGLVPAGSGGVLRGDIRVGGRRPSVEGMRAVAGVLSHLPQDVEGFAVASTVEQELASGVEFSRMSAGQVGMALAEVADDLAIGHLLGRRMTSLSGGERQLVSVATALVRPVAAYILDEPLAQLDGASTAAVLAALAERGRRHGASVVLSEQLELPGDSGYRSFVLRGGSASGQLEESPADARTSAGEFTPGDAVVILEGVRLDRAGAAVLDDVSLSLRQGEVVAVVGANGSGKTSLLRVCAGLVRPSSGRVWTGARFRVDESPVRRAPLLGFLLQSVSSLFFRESVGDEVGALPAHRQADAAAFALRGPLSVTDVSQRHPLDLSTGQRQWLALALLEAQAPDVLLLDEPTRGLHRSHRVELGRHLRERAAAGACVAFATHDADFATAWADRLVRLDRGRVVGLGVPVKP